MKDGERALLLIPVFIVGFLFIFVNFIMLLNVINFDGFHINHCM